MGKIQTVLFDWDGTLAQTLEVWLNTFREAYAAVDLYPSDIEISSRFGNWNAHIELGVTKEKEAIYEKSLEQVYQRLNSVELYPGAKEVLLKLKQDNFKLGLVSTSNRKMINAALINNGLEDIFDVTLAAEDTVKHKPDPEPIITALEMLGASKDSTVFVGDSDKDTGAAYNAGVGLFLFAPESHKLYYNLNDLQAETSVKSVFNSWEDFPFTGLS